MLVISACQTSLTEVDQKEGRISGPPEGMNRIILLESDSLTGDSFSVHVNRHQIADYNTNSYFLHVPRDAVIEIPSGEELYLDQVKDLTAVFHKNQKVTVKSDQAIHEQKNTELTRYVTYQPKFLPVIQIERIILHPLEPTDLASLYKPLDGGSYYLLILTIDEEMTSNMLHTDLQELLVGMRLEPIFYEVSDQQKQLITETEKYILLNSDGILLETKNESDILRYFDKYNNRQ